MTTRKCFTSITSSFASIYLISAFFAVSFFSLLYLKYPPQYTNHFDYLNIIKHNPTPEIPTTVSLTDDDYSTPSVSLLKESVITPIATPSPLPSPVPVSEPPTEVVQEQNLTTSVQDSSEDSATPTVDEEEKVEKTDESSPAPAPAAVTEQQNDNGEGNKDDSAEKKVSDEKIAPESAAVNEKTEKSEERREDEDDESAIASVDHLSYPPINSTTEERMAWIKQKLPESRIIESTPATRKFEQKLQQYVSANKCRVTIFMTWISTTRFFGKREMFSLESVVKAHPGGCVIIVSRIMASKQGRKLLEQLVQRGHLIFAVAPDFELLFHGTPAQEWLQKLKDGQMDPGKIPITQNLSNLLRIVILYKYGGVYLDTDMIILKDLSVLRNTIGIQEVDEKSSTWNSVNNAVLIFDRDHPLLLRFMEEFSSTFDGNVWGYNGPYMATRIIKKIVYDTNYQFNIMSPIAFYPVDWFNARKLFINPKSNNDIKWAKDMEAKVRAQSYGVHLWNKISGPSKIEKGSIIGRLILDTCIICRTQDVYG